MHEPHGPPQPGPAGQSLMHWVARGFRGLAVLARHLAVPERAGLLSSAWRRLRIRLLGYDIFICFAHGLGHPYANALEESLTKQGYTCFLDRTEMMVGTALTPAITWALKRSKLLLIVTTERATNPAESWVPREIITYQEVRGPRKQLIVPIEFVRDGRVLWHIPVFPRSKHPLANVTEIDLRTIRRPEEELTAPSMPPVTAEIQQLARFIRTRTLSRGLLAIASLALLTAIGFGAYSYNAAIANKAEQLIAEVGDLTLDAGLSATHDALTRYACRVRVAIRTVLAQPQHGAPEVDRTALHVANWATALAHLEPAAPEVWGLLDNLQNPRVRTYLIHRLRPPDVPAQTIIDQLRLPNAPPARRQALLLALGGYKLSDLAGPEQTTFPRWLIECYRDEENAGVHSGAEWLLRQWQLESLAVGADEELAKRGFRHDLAPGSWFIHQGHTLVTVCPETGKAFCISTKEVTVAQFHRFAAAFDQEHLLLRAVGAVGLAAAGYEPGPFVTSAALARASDGTLLEKYLSVFRDSKADHPMDRVTWYDAALYCNWLSRTAGLSEAELCYPRDFEGWLDMRVLVKDAMSYERHTGKGGFRLPTSQEWELAGRGEATTPYCFGTDVRILGRYASYRDVHGHLLSVGILKPNAYGLFDVHGNVAEWCQDRFHKGIPLAEQEREKGRREARSSRVQRGGGAIRPAEECRFEYIDVLPANSSFRGVGFRVARSLE